MFEPTGDGWALVTGAPSGIGEAVARRLAARGMRTILAARRAEPLEKLARELRQTTGSMAYPMDLADEDSVEEAARDLAKGDRPVHVLINNGGGGLCEPFTKITPDQERELMQVHYHAPLTLIRELLPKMIDRNHGRVINVTSIAAKVGPWGHSAYAAAKAALTTHTHALAAEHAGTDVRFCCVMPGVVRTPFFDHPSYGDFGQTLRKHGIAPDRVAKAIVRRIDRPRVETVVPGHYRAVDWLRAISPSLMSWVVGKGSGGGNAQ